MPLPDLDHHTYWTAFHRKGAAAWRDALDHIAATHGFDFDGATRAPQGRNVVLLAGAYAVKLIPPFWRHMWTRECRALELVRGALSVDTPELLAAGDVGAWTYVVMNRIPARTYGSREELHVSGERLSVAALQGRLIREVSGLVLADPHALRCDWDLIFTEQREELAEGLTDLPAELAATAHEYVLAAGDLRTGDTVFLHGDVMCVNIIPPSGGRAVTLIDWSDATVGPADHEFISPLMHQFRGAPEELEQFWSGYGEVPDADALEHRVMARSILKYARLLHRYLADLPGPMPASWTDAARRFCCIPR